MKRNAWYARWAAARIPDHTAEVLFSYSYTAGCPFRSAQSRGMRCILGQIDGAWREEQLWREATAAYHGLEIEVDEAPAEYWEQWREETDMADKIVVNSPWSRSLILEAGVKANKIVEIPLVYEPEARSHEWRVTGGERKEEEAGGVASPPQAKGAEWKKPSRRLKALFLGNVVLRKGVGQLFDAIRLLKREPVDFIFAGPVRVHVPNDIRSMSNIRLIGPVDRVAAARLYRESDVFLFPTLSDGFGLTQLEALGHGCPVIASTNCARVIEHRMNGLLLEKVTPESIAESIMELVRNPDLLAQLKAQASVPDRFNPRHLASALLALEE